MAIIDDLEALITKRPGLTEAELAEALFGVDAYQQRVNSTCRRLIKQERVVRRGKGYSDPYTYHTKSS
jgi:hypothetical protein